MFRMKVFLFLLIVDYTLVFGKPMEPPDRGSFIDVGQHNIQHVKVIFLFLMFEAKSQKLKPLKVRV